MSSAAPATKSSRVLVIDDNRDQALTLGEVLEMAGLQARLAFDGASALSIAQEWRPDVVLLDLRLPGMDGYEVARRLRELCGQAAPRVIIVSGSVATEPEGDLYEHLTKPIDIERLVALLTA